MSKIKIKVREKEGVVKALIQMKHEMMTYNTAKKKGIKANFITSVVAKVGEKVVYELSSSQFLSENPIVKFKFQGSKGETLTITWTDMSGKHVTESKKIK